MEHRAWPRGLGATTLAAILSMGAAGAWAETTPAEAAFIRQIVAQHRITETVFAPDGRHALFVVAEPPQGKTRRSSLWLYETAGGGVRQLTFAGVRDSRPRWSPDSRGLAFLSKRGDAAPQIYRMDLGGGEAEALTSLKAGIDAFEWSPKGDAIAYLAKVPAAERPDRAEGDDARVVRLEQGRSQVSVLNLATRKATELPLGSTWSVGLFGWAPDGDTLVISATDAFLPEHAINRLYAVKVADGARRELGVMPGVEFSSLQLSPDGRRIAFLASGDGPMPHDLYLQDLAGGPMVNVTGAGSRAAIDRPVVDVRWTGPDTLGFAIQDGFGGAIYRLSATSGKAERVRVFNAAAIGAVGFGPGDALLYAKTTPTTPVELWTSRGRDERKLTTLHEGFPSLAAPQKLSYAGSGGVAVEAELFKPAGQGPFPTVVLVHGGPTGRWSYAVNDWAQVLQRRGIAVLAPNIRGSVGYGYAFVKSNRGDWGGGDFQDVIAGVDKMIADGVADPNRLAIAGWSYGGYMSAWATTQTQRFKAAVVGAAMLDLETQLGLESPEIVPYDNWYMGTPWDNPEAFAKMSPISHVKAVKTPTLLLVGEDDPVDPIAQNWQYYRALRMNGVEAEMVIYPREGHRLGEEAHLKDMVGRMADWLEDHLGGAVAGQP